MRFSESWLREFVNPKVPLKSLVNQLNMAGLEVDSVSPSTPVFHSVVIGEVVSKKMHPDASKLSVTTVDIGTDEQLCIVCGAKNVAVGQRVPVAQLGAELPNGQKITNVEIRGVKSEGMICSSEELGLTETSDGIWELPVEAPVGIDIRQWLDLDDQCIDVDLTPDRSDCLSLRGIARDVSVINRCDLNIGRSAEIPAAHDEAIAIKLIDDDDCPRYCGRIIKNINPKTQTPLWMQEKLRRSGIRSISPTVDITNFVLLELGQPMHAFDLAKLDSGIHVRKARQGEKLTLLDGTEITLNDKTLVIADASMPVAMAGIMGGEDSGVSESTQDILLESAFFRPESIAGRARGYGLHTESSHRFERGVDPALQMEAIDRATALILEIVGGEPGPVIEAISEDFNSARPAIRLRSKRINQLLGVEVDSQQVADILTRLGMTVEEADKGWMVTPPSWRFDIAIEADLIGEIGRIYGYDNIPAVQKHQPMQLQLSPEKQTPLHKIRTILNSRDYQEVITYSFISQDAAKRLAPDQQQIVLTNPISEELSVMRPTLLAGLLETAKYNLARQQNRIRIFETGLRFMQTNQGIEQTPGIAGLITGPLFEEQWAVDQRACDFYDLKADLEALLAHRGKPSTCHFVPTEKAALHPGQTAKILCDGEGVGIIGVLHPRYEKIYGIKHQCVLFEIDLAVFEQGAVPKFRSLSKYPFIKRDFAIVVDKNIDYDQVITIIRENSSESLRNVQLFDIYTGEQIESGTKSLALSLILQDKSRTLEELDVQQISQKILDALEKHINAKLRES